MSLIAARSAMVGGGAKLPYDAEVDYLESTGTQWIDTGIVPTNSHGFSISCALNGASATNYNSRAIGVHQGNVRWLFSLQHVGNNTFFGWNTAISNLGGYSNLQTVEASLNFINDRKAILDGSVKASDLGNLGAISRTAYLFANNRDASGEMFLGRIFSCKISNRVNVVRDFIPVRIGTEGAMYDRANPTVGMNRDGTPRNDGLYLNRGTGSFVLPTA